MIPQDVRVQRRDAIQQRLAAALCDHCRKMYKPQDAELDELIEEYGREAFAGTGISRESIVLAKPVGCNHCHGTGYRGRLGIHELLDCGDAMKSLIRKKGETDSVRELSVAQGMTSLKQDGILKVMQGLTEIHEIRRVCIK